jgi:hypothetical protein
VNEEPSPRLLEERIAHLRELVDLRDKLNEKALALAAAQASTRTSNIIAVVAVIVALYAIQSGRK